MLDYSSVGSKRNAYAEKIQLEMNSDATEYEEYVIPQTANCDSDGKIDEVTSVSPNMLITSNTENATISLEYIADTKKYIDKKICELISQ